MSLTNIKMVKNLCAELGIRPSKKFGQNFLVSKKVLGKIIKAGELSPGDVVLEIGPGFGVLTQEIAWRVRRLVVVERDKRLAEFIKTLKHKNIKAKLKVFGDDILTLDIEDIFQGDSAAYNNHKNRSGQGMSYKLISNLPYQITSPVLWKFLHQEENKPELMVLMVQREVAERIVARPRHSTGGHGKLGQMSLLSVLCQFYADCKIVSMVSPSNFWPPPEVDSAIIKLKIYSPAETAFEGNKVNKTEFFKFVKIGFSAKRKMLKNNLTKELDISQDKVVKALKVADLNEKARAQELGVGEWIKLFKILRNKV